MKKTKNNKGQALVTLLIFIMMGLAIAVAASFIVASNSMGATNVQEGQRTRQMADSGMETAYLAILRQNNNYPGETIADLDGGEVVITVSWVGDTATIESVATNGKFVKKVESVVTYDNNGLTKVSWKEIY
ncbi:MAG TPA: hypothetical protein VJ227_00890 [Patescibacteria group bacterium]|nr:hypothetical protein [Patescibacteria group bacterium]